MNEQEPADPQLQNFILAETQKQRFQVIFPHIFNSVPINTYNLIKSNLAIIRCV